MKFKRAFLLLLAVMLCFGCATYAFASENSCPYDHRYEYMSCLGGNYVKQIVGTSHHCYDMWYVQCSHECIYCGYIYMSNHYAYSVYSHNMVHSGTPYTMECTDCGLVAYT